MHDMHNVHATPFGCGKRPHRLKAAARAKPDGYVRTIPTVQPSFLTRLERSDTGLHRQGTVPRDLLAVVGQLGGCVRQHGQRRRRRNDDADNRSGRQT